MWNLHNPYEYRNTNLRTLGFASYRAYRKSTLWHGIRTTVLLRYRMCQSCGMRAATQVHHRAYDLDTLTGRCLNSLSALCARCHRKGERPQCLIQDRHDRLQRANNVALRGHRRRTSVLTEPIDAPPLWRVKPERQKKAGTVPPFSTNMRPRLVRP